MKRRKGEKGRGKEEEKTEGRERKEGGREMTTTVHLQLITL